MHDEIRHREARRAADDMDVDVDDAGAGQQPPPALLSALAVPDDPLDEKINGFFGFGCADSGAWFAEFCGGSMDMSTRAGVDFLEMLLDGESSSEAAARAGEAAVATMNVSPSLSSSDDEDEWMDSSSESEDDAADAHWLPSESASKNTSATGSGKKRRLPRQQQQTAAAAGQRKPQQTEPAVVVEGGGGGSKGGYWCRRCAKLETPLWRAGPEGPKTLCNACGLRYKNSLAAMAVPAMTTTTKRLPTAAKPGGRSAKSKNRSGSVSATVVRKKRT